MRTPTECLAKAIELERAADTPNSQRDPAELAELAAWWRILAAAPLASELGREAFTGVEPSGSWQQLSSRYSGRRDH